MGVSGIWQIIQPAARRCSIEELSGLRIALDVSIYIRQMLHARSSAETDITARIIIGMLKRLGELLRHGVKPIVVFDGRPPEAKRLTMVFFSVCYSRNVDNRKNVDFDAKKMLSFATNALLQNTWHPKYKLLTYTHALEVKNGI